MRRRDSLLGIALAALASSPALAQQVYRCTTPDGKVTYQQAPCPKTADERKVDATPANTDYDPSKRDEILRKGEEAGKRLEERAAREAEEARLRQERLEREKQLEREAQEREAARDQPVIIYGGWPNRPIQPGPPRPQPKPAPKSSASPTR